MSWPIGYLPQEIVLESSGDAVMANGSQVTDDKGWIELPPPTDVQAAWRTLRVRIHVERDRDGRAFVYAREVKVGAKVYSGIHALALSEGGGWIAYLPRAVITELTARAFVSRARASTGVFGPTPVRDATRDAAGGGQRSA